MSELHPKSWANDRYPRYWTKPAKGVPIKKNQQMEVQFFIGKELFTEELKLTVVHRRLWKDALERKRSKKCVFCIPIENR